MEIVRCRRSRSTSRFLSSCISSAAETMAPTLCSVTSITSSAALTNCAMKSMLLKPPRSTTCRSKKVRRRFSSPSASENEMSRISASETGRGNTASPFGWRDSAVCTNTWSKRRRLRTASTKWKWAGTFRYSAPSRNGWPRSSSITSPPEVRRTSVARLAASVVAPTPGRAPRMASTRPRRVGSVDARSASSRRTTRTASAGAPSTSMKSFTPARSAASIARPSDAEPTATSGKPGNSRANWATSCVASPMASVPSPSFWSCSGTSIRAGDDAKRTNTTSGCTAPICSRKASCPLVSATSMPSSRMAPASQRCTPPDCPSAWPPPCRRK